MEQFESTAANLDRRSRMSTRRRWFQFSLRGLLALLTVFAIGLGWKVERARKRGEAIHAIQKLGGSVFYDGGTDEAIFYYRVKPEPSDNHFWLDLKGTPVDIVLITPLTTEIGSRLSPIYGTDTIKIWSPTDADLRFLDASDARKIMLLDADELTQEATDRLRRHVPNATINIYLRVPPDPMLYEELESLLDF